MDAIQAVQHVWTVCSKEAPRVYTELPPILQILVAIGAIVAIYRIASGKAFLG